MTTVADVVNQLKGLSPTTRSALAHLLWVYGPRDKLPKFLNRYEEGEGLWGPEFWVNQTLREQPDLMKNLRHQINEGSLKELTTAVLAMLPEYEYVKLKLTFPLPDSM